MMGFASSTTGPMIHHLRLHFRQRSLVAYAWVAGTLVSLFLLSHASAPWVFSRLHNDSVYSDFGSPFPAAQDFADLVSALWKPYIHDLNNRTFTTDNGRFYEIPKTHRHWSEPMGKDVLILDVDTRPAAEQHFFHKHSVFDDEEMTPRMAGMLNHYIYAQIHGYDYRFMRAPAYRDRHQTWVKVPSIREALKTHKFVVFLDSDAVFTQPQVPLEWLLSLWDVKDRTLLAMPEDPNSPVNRDANGWVLWNTGFIVAQQSERTDELLDTWEACPTGSRFPECRRWARDWAHEQAAFGNHVRYAYNATDNLRAISCMDANGAPYIVDKKCGGVFVSHHWGSKHMTVKGLHDIVSKVLLRHLQDGRNDLVFDAFVHPMHDRLNRALDDLLLEIAEA